MGWDRVCSKRELVRNSRKWIALMALCFLFVFVKFLMWYRGTSTEDYKFGDLSAPRYVYFWNRPGWIENTLFENCEAKCLLVADYHGYNRSHAVIFHVSSLDVTYLPVKLPGQVWVAYVTEPPDRLRASFKNWQYVFNWTMSYRRDSDILALTGEFYVKHRQHEERRVSSLWDRKVRPVSYSENNCHTQSRREDYVRDLQKHVLIHAYGRCGNYTCPRLATLWPFDPHDSCLPAIDHDYKFHLAFERSICIDYITERVYNLYRLNSVIPVVRGGANYDIFLPPGSYISTSNFPNPHSLGKHIRHLSGKKANTFQPFRYKNNFEIRPDDRRYFCDLCKRLHAVELSERFYANFDAWIRGHNGWPWCVKPWDF